MNENERIQLIARGIFSLGEDEWECERLMRQLDQIELEYLNPVSSNFALYEGSYRDVFQYASKEGLFYSKEDLLHLVKIFARILRLQGRIEEAEALESEILLYKKNLEEFSERGFYRKDWLYHMTRREEQLGNLRGVLKNQMDLFLLYVLEEEPKLTKTGRISTQDAGNLALTCDFISYNESQGLEGGERNFPALELMRHFALKKSILYPMEEHLTMGLGFDMYKLLTEEEFTALWIDFLLSQEAMDTVYTGTYSYLEPSGEDFIHHFFTLLLWASRERDYRKSPLKKNKTIFYLSQFLSLSLLEEKNERFILTQLGRGILEKNPLKNPSGKVSM